MKNLRQTLTSLILLAILCGCANGGQPREPLSFDEGKLTVTFDYEKQSGYATNQFAIWVEDTDGNFTDTIYATRFTANGGYKNRPDSVPEWTAKSGLAEMEKAEIDAVAYATPQAGTVSYDWDLKNSEGESVPAGEYKFFVEGSLRWKNRVLYSGVIEIGNGAAVAEASAEYFYEASDDQPALSAESTENGMIAAVKAEFIPR